MLVLQSVVVILQVYSAQPIKYKCFIFKDKMQTLFLLLWNPLAEFRFEELAIASTIDAYGI